MDTQKDIPNTTSIPEAKGRRENTRVYTKRSKGSENSAAPPKSKSRDPKSTGPKPTMLATKPKNEPMFSDLDTMGFPGLAPYRSTNEFAITAEGFIPLVEKEFDVRATNQPYFAKVVPKSAWVYYCVQCLYARLVGLRQEDGDSTYEEISFLNQVLAGNPCLPGPIEAYIKGLGHVVDNCSLRYRLRTPAWPSVNGDFGRVSHLTHWKYMSMPCPRVCAMRIQEDLRMTANQGERDWNLPAALVPVEDTAGMPTRNLLGWARATVLTNDQVAFLENANVMENNFPTEFRQFYYSTDLFEKISIALDKTKEIKITPQTEGALAQVCWAVVEPTEQETSPNVFYAESRDNQIIASSKIDIRQVLLSLILSYRVRKDQIGQTRPYCVYRFNNYTAVPDTWHRTRNSVFEYGQSNRWNIMEYTAPFTDKSGHRLRWLEKHVNSPNAGSQAPSS